MLGALSRYYIAEQIIKLFGGGFPWQTIIINTLGSFLMGFIFELTGVKLNLSEEFRLFIIVGFLGSFTTFSTFSIDVMILINKQLFIPALLYISCSVILSIISIFFAVWITRNFII